jgi:class 3 adenylate cyclase/pimeloyl-ACP methyl ester carboxylesterase
LTAGPTVQHALAVHAPQTKYTTNAGASIAYQVVGDGPIDVVFMGSWFSHVEAIWDSPGAGVFLPRLAALGRLIQFDKRGVGLSDPVPLTSLPTLEEWMEDLRAVLDVAESPRTVVMAAVDAGPMAMLFAATYPERTAGLILGGSYARFARADDYPWGAPPEWIQAAPEWLRSKWGTTEYVRAFSRGWNEELVEASARWFRLCASPGMAAALLAMAQQIDVRNVLPSIRVPTLVIHRKDDSYIRVEHGRYLAEHITGARYVELPGSDPGWGSTDDLAWDEIEEFLTGHRPVPQVDRVLATVMFTDLVGSTERAAQLGDHRWKELLEKHNEIVRRELKAHRGREVKTVGDGFLATFDGPARAILCARAIQDRLRALELEMRVGLHTGEVELMGDDVGGVGVHIAARVAALADGGDILVSRTVTDLVAGSGIEFDDRGMHPLKGLSGEWQLFAVRA